LVEAFSGVRTLNLAQSSLLDGIPLLQGLPFHGATYCKTRRTRVSTRIQQGRILDPARGHNTKRLLFSAGRSIRVPESVEYKLRH
jgi:hypothetical protein